MAGKTFCALERQSAKTYHAQVWEAAGKNKPTYDSFGPQQLCVQMDKVCDRPKHQMERAKSWASEAEMRELQMEGAFLMQTTKSANKIDSNQMQEIAEQNTVARPITRLIVWQDDHGGKSSKQCSEETPA